jgi:hypothetical protein
VNVGVVFSQADSGTDPQAILAVKPEIDRLIG